MTTNGPGSLLADLRSIGIFFAEKPSKDANPEEVLIASLGVLAQDAKLLYLVANWMSVYADLIHTERLLFLIKNSPIPLTSLLLLAGLCRHASKEAKKLRLVCRKVKEQTKKIKKLKKSSVAEYMELPVKMGQCQTNPDFKEFGIMIPPIVDLQDKILSVDVTAKTNLHIRMRVLFGASWRAEIAAYLLQNSETTFYRLRKDLGCTNETALRIGKQLRMIHASGKPLW
ncbi:MAG: hypothetical protein HY072_07030 [Deltaproteobacteria bacterium]|nr:hypothetical protein [Deltaproteobacteria bacterium]